MDTATRAVVTLPKLLGSRQRARNLVTSTVHPGTQDVVLNAMQAESVAQGAADEIVKQLLAAQVTKVVVLNPTAKLENDLRRALDHRAQPGEGFILLTQRRDASVLYRE